MQGTIIFMAVTNTMEFQSVANFSIMWDLARAATWLNKRYVLPRLIYWKLFCEGISKTVSLNISWFMILSNQLPL